MKLFHHRWKWPTNRRSHAASACSSVFNLHLRPTDSSHIIEFAICIFRLYYALANDRVSRYLYTPFHDRLFILFLVFHNDPFALLILRSNAWKCPEKSTHPTDLKLTFGHNFLDGVLLQSNGSQGTLKGWFNETFSAFLHTILQLYCRSISHLVMAAAQNCLRRRKKLNARPRGSLLRSSPKGILLMIQQHWGPIICKTPS